MLDLAVVHLKPYKIINADSVPLWRKKASTHYIIIMLIMVCEVCDSSHPPALLVNVYVCVHVCLHDLYIHA